MNANFPAIEFEISRLQAANAKLYKENEELRAENFKLKRKSNYRPHTCTMIDCPICNPTTGTPLNV